MQPGEASADERQALTRLRAYGGLMDSSLIEVHLALVEEHVAQGARHIARQRDLVDLLSRGGRDTEDARALLRRFEESQAMNLADRDRLRKELRESG